MGRRLPHGRRRGILGGEAGRASFPGYSVAMGNPAMIFAAGPERFQVPMRVIRPLTDLAYSEGLMEVAFLNAREK